MELKYTPEAFQQALTETSKSSAGVPFEGLQGEAFKFLYGMPIFLLVFAVEAFHNLRHNALVPIAESQGWISIAIAAGLLFPLSLYFVILVHELGHLIAGLLVRFQFIAMKVGNIQISRRTTGIRVTVNRSASASGGQVLLAPTSSDNLRLRLLTFIAAGPSFSAFLLIILSLIGAQSASQTLNKWYAVFLHEAIILDCVVLVVSLLPTRSVISCSDGLAILRLFMRKEALERHLSLAQYLPHSFRNLGLTLLPDVDIESLLLPADASNNELTATMINYYQAVHQNNYEKAMYACNRSLEILIANPAARKRLQPLLACADFAFRYIKDEELGNAWFLLSLQQVALGWVPEEACCAVHIAAKVALSCGELSEAKALATMGVDYINKNNPSYNVKTICAELQSILDIVPEEVEEKAVENKSNESQQTRKTELQKHSRSLNKLRLNNAMSPIITYAMNYVSYLAVLAGLAMSPVDIYYHTHYRNIGRACMAQMQEDCALAAFQSNLDYFPTYETYQNIGIILSHRGQNAEALQMLNKSIEMGHDDGLTANLERGLLYFKAQNFVQAADDFKAVIEEGKEESTQEQAIPKLAEIYFKLGKRSLYDDLNESYQPSIDDESTLDSPKWSSPYYFQAQLHQDVGEYDKAIQDDTVALAHSQDDNERIMLYLLRSGLYQETENLAAAIEDCTTAIAIQPQNTTGYLYRYLLYDQQGNVEKASADLDKVISLEPESAENYTLRAAFWEQHKQFGQALIDYNKAIELQPNWGETYFSRALLYQTTGKVTLAIADITKAIELEPDSTYFYASRAEMYRADKQFDLAVADYDKVINAEPKAMGLRIQRADVYAEQRNIASARADLEYILENGDNRELKRQAKEKLDALSKLNL